jgi:hypothetical protein
MPKNGCRKDPAFPYLKMFNLNIHNIANRKTLRGWQCYGFGSLRMGILKVKF